MSSSTTESTSADTCLPSSFQPSRPIPSHAHVHVHGLVHVHALLMCSDAARACCEHDHDDRRELTQDILPPYWLI